MTVLIASALNPSSLIPTPATPIFLSIVLPVMLILLTASLSFIAAMYWAARKQREALADRVHILESQMGVVGAQILPISAAFQAILVKELTHFHTPEMDALMVKLGPPSVLTEVEEARLIVMLGERVTTLNGKISDDERSAAVILPAIIRRARTAINGKRLLLVSIPDDPKSN